MAKKIDATKLKVGDVITVLGCSYEVCKGEPNACMGCDFDSVIVPYIDCTPYIKNCPEANDIIFKRKE